MSRRLRGAIIGFGAVAEHGHLPTWQRDPRFDLLAVAEPAAERRDRAATLLPEARIFPDAEAMFAAIDVDFVDVASPPASHLAAIEAAARRRLHVLCEKPLVTSNAEFLRASAAVAEAGVVLHPVHNWRHAEGFRVLRALAGEIGPLRQMHFRVERNGWSVSAGDWRAQRHVSGGGILVDHGWHTFYLARELAGVDPRVVRATTAKRRYRDADVEDSAHCEIDFDACRAVIDLTWAGAARRTEWEIVGAGGRARLSDDVLTFERNGVSTTRRLAASLSAGSHHPEWFPQVVDAFAGEIADLARRGTAQREAKVCLNVLTAAYASVAQGGRDVVLGRADR